MNQTERRQFLIRALLAERSDAGRPIPRGEREQKILLRSLLNVRAPAPASPDLLAVQDAYLREEIARKGITSLSDLSPVAPGLYLWQGDVTTLAVDAIVNAANSALLGCFCPCHGCIDNAIHTFAGLQLRAACADLMARQGHEEPVGSAKITPAFNLPSRYVIHTVGPTVLGPLTARHEAQLASCYRSCLDLAAANGCASLAFCCISTGEFRFPPDRAAEIAVATVRRFLTETHSEMKVIFNVFKETDKQIYERLFRSN